MEELGGDEYSPYWEAQTFLKAGEFDCFEDFDWSSLIIPDEGISSHQDSNSPEGSTTTSSEAAKNAITERNRRRILDEKLYNLRSVVPNITKMDKVSILKDAINYIEKLQEEEKTILAEMTATTGEEAIPTFEQNSWSSQERSKKRRKVVPRSESMEPPIEVTSLQVSEVGEMASLVSIRCRKRRGTVAMLCEVLDTLGLKIISGNITSLSGQLLHNLLVEADEIERTQLKEKIEMAINFKA